MLGNWGEGGGSGVIGDALSGVYEWFMSSKRLRDVNLI